MEKTARKPSTDANQEKLRQDKANWNKNVSAFVNDLIHFKKMMNGWPSKFFKERSFIQNPIPADPATIIGSLAGDFQEIVNHGNSIIQQQINYAKTRQQKQPKKTNLTSGQPQTATPAEAPKPDLTQQLALSQVELNIVKLAFSLENKYNKLIILSSSLENKYLLESEASNAFSRFITKILTPQFGIGEAARIRRLRMTMLDSCVKSYKELKKLHNEIIKSSKSSIITSHKIMTSVWNHWNPVNRLFASFKMMRPKPVIDPGGEIESPEMKLEREQEQGQEQENNQLPATTTPQDLPLYKIEKAKNIMNDYNNYAKLFNSTSGGGSLQELESLIEKIKATPKANRIDIINNSNIDVLYEKVLQILNQELNTNGTSLKDISNQLIKMKAMPPAAPLAETGLATEAQLGRWLGKVRHQILPGAASGTRLEIYRIIEKIKKDLNEVMNLLEKGFDEEKLNDAIGLVNREMGSLRTMMRSLYYSEKPEEIPTSSFF